MVKASACARPSVRTLRFGTETTFFLNRQKPYPFGFSTSCPRSWRRGQDQSCLPHSLEYTLPACGRSTRYSKALAMVLTARWPNISW
ncbi:hypothetical protein R1flu_004606 [Riccia fluitans]|uniref:Uncharacterized protein n=1 Tax=Riccia fluitans TaxID=41844 RepID=A0ABD1YUT7_9MARC